MRFGRKNWFYWSSQICGWGMLQVFILILSIFSGSVFPTNTLWLSSFIGFFILILATHLLRYIILRNKWLSFSIWSILWRTFLAILTLSILVESFDLIVSYFLEKDFYVDEKDKVFSISKFIAGIFFNSILFLLWAGFYYTYLFVEKSRNQEIRNLQFEASKNEIELKNLRAQINPHFLFNSLNSIKALVELDKDEAKLAITKLSNLLRKSIQLSKNKLIYIREELEIVETYIDLEKIRFEERIQKTIDVDKTSLNCKIPPLMIQTLVENAIKHGLSQEIEGGELILTIKKNVDQIEIRIKNTGVMDLNKSDRGIGLENTKKRLRILFGARSEFNIQQEGNYVCAYLKFECK
jgi:sensor histidine kinase YesM